MIGFLKSLFLINTFVLRSNNDPLINTTVVIGKYLHIDELIAVECPMLSTGGPECFPSLGAKIVTQFGRRVISVDEIGSGEVLHMVFSGSRFVYHQPLGQEFTTSNGMRMKQLSYRPRIFEFTDRVVSDQEVSMIIANASTRLYPSTVGSERSYSRSPFRTSSNTVDAGSPVFNRLRVMAGSLLGLDLEPGIVESMQIIRYLPGEFYMPHTDYFQDDLIRDPIWNNGSNRFATIFMYLTDLPGGGETVFPLSVDTKAEGWSVERFMSECIGGSKSIRFTPKKGRGFLFYSQHPNGTVDPFSLHGACPPRGGVKWAANLWILNRSPGDSQECMADGTRGGPMSLNIENSEKEMILIYWYEDDSGGCEADYRERGATLVASISALSGKRIDTFRGRLFRSFYTNNTMISCFVAGDGGF